MSLDIWLTKTMPTAVFDANITHNLGRMAEEAGIYDHLWHPARVGVTKAEQLIDPLQKALTAMYADPARFKAFDAGNGWGTYEQFLPWLQRLQTACMEHPDAEVGVSI